MRDDEDMIQLDRYTDVRQAEFALSILEGSGIEGFVDVPYVSSMFPHLAFAAGVSLYVRTEDEERAREVLENAEQEE
jgi:hypothetical protein